MSFISTCSGKTKSRLLISVSLFFLFLSGCSTSPLYTPQPVPRPEATRVPPVPPVEARPPENNIPTNRENVVIISPEQGTQQARPRTNDTSPQHIASLELVDVGKQNIEAGNIDRGISMLERAVSLDAYNSRAYYYLSVAWLKKNQPARALEFARKAELLCQGKKQELKKIYLLESDIYERMGNSDKADMYRWKAKKL